MRLAVVSDIHGNLPALEAVRQHIATTGADVVVNLGDIVSGPLWPAETADLLMSLHWPTIAGNHERQVLDPAIDAMGASDRHAAERLTDVHRAWLAGMPPRIRLTHEVLCCHGTPSSDLDYLMETVTETAPGLRAATVDEVEHRLDGALAGERNGLILCGHSHLPRVLRLRDGRLVVNPGSVGLQAYDAAHPLPHVVENPSPHARYALVTLHAGGWKAELRIVPYDWEASADRADLQGRADWGFSLETGKVDAPR